MSPDLTWLPAAGGPRDIGLALGRAGREAVARHLLSHPLWAMVNAPAHAPRTARMAEATRARFPAIWAEIEGLADEGLTWRVTELARASRQADRPEMQGGDDLGEDRQALADALRQALEGEIWRKRR